MLFKKSISLSFLILIHCLLSLHTPFIAAYSLRDDWWEKMQQRIAEQTKQRQKEEKLVHYWKQKNNQQKQTVKPQPKILKQTTPVTPPKQEKPSTSAQTVNTPSTNPPIAPGNQSQSISPSKSNVSQEKIPATPGTATKPTQRPSAKPADSSSTINVPKDTSVAKNSSLALANVTVESPSTKHISKDAQPVASSPATKIDTASAIVTSAKSDNDHQNRNSPDLKKTLPPAVVVVLKNNSAATPETLKSATLKNPPTECKATTPIAPVCSGIVEHSGLIQMVPEAVKSFGPAAIPVVAGVGLYVGLKHGFSGIKDFVSNWWSGEKNSGFAQEKKKFIAEQQDYIKKTNAVYVTRLEKVNDQIAEVIYLVPEQNNDYPVKFIGVNSIAPDKYGANPPLGATIATSSQRPFLQGLDDDDYQPNVASSTINPKAPCKSPVDIPEKPHGCPTPQPVPEKPAGCGKPVQQPPLPTPGCGGDKLPQEPIKQGECSGKPYFPERGGCEKQATTDINSDGSKQPSKQTVTKETTKQKIEWTPHDYKHFPKSQPWKQTVKETAHGDAKYKTNNPCEIEKIERAAWELGTPCTNGRTWKVMKFDEIIGAKKGIETNYIRVEMSANTIHGHPITPEEYKKYIKQTK